MDKVRSKIDKRNRTPLYIQLADIIRQAIQSGEYTAGERLPPERNMVAQYKLSRNTVRQSISILEDEGLVYKDHGRGTFVSRVKRTNHIRIDTFIEHTGILALSGYEPSIKQLSNKIEKPDEYIQERLELENGEKVLHRKTITFADGNPAIYSEEYLASHFTNNKVKPWDPDNMGFFDFLEEVTGERALYVSIDIFPIVAIGEMPALMRIPDCSPLLLLEATKFGSMGRKPLGFGRNYYQPDIIQFSVLRS